MRKILSLLALPALIGACSSDPDPEAVVHIDDPLYCYRSIGGVRCFETPYHRDERRMVSYYGPAPHYYARPLLPPPAQLYAPPTIEHFARDPEPVPEPGAPKAAPVPPVQRR